MKTKRTRKSFEVVNIATDKDGRVYLYGPQGMISVQRKTDFYSGAHWEPIETFEWLQGDGAKEIHAVSIKEIPKDGNIAF